MGLARKFLWNLYNLTLHIFNQHPCAGRAFSRNKELNWPAIIKGSPSEWNFTLEISYHFECHVPKQLRWIPICALSCYFVEGSAHCLSPPTCAGKLIGCAVCLVCTLAFYVEHIASPRGSHQLFVFMVKELEDKKPNKQQLVHWLCEAFV